MADPLPGPDARAGGADPPACPAFLLRGDAFWERALRELKSAGYLPGPAAETRLDLLYLDTVEGRLARDGWRLVLCGEGGRLEVRTQDPSGSEPGGGLPFNGDPHAPVFDARALTREAEILLRAAKKPLVPVLRVRVRRREVEIRTPEGAAARLVMDRFPAPGPDRRGARGHLSLRLLPGSDPAAGLHLQVLLRDRVGLAEAPGDLLTTALRLAGRPEPGALPPPASPVRSEDALGLAARKIVALQTHRLGLQVPWALRDLHPEFVHDARVATRRLRTALRLLAPYLGPRRAESLRLELAWAGRLLGQVRDLDVFLEELRAMERRLPEGMSLPHGLVDRLLRDRSEALEAMVSGLSGRRFAALLDRLGRLAASPAPKGRPGAPPPTAGRAAPVLLLRAEKQARRMGRAVEAASPSEALHRLRILFKRLRYTGEFFETVLGGAMGPYLRAVVALQDTLGAHQDAVVGARRLVEAAEAPAARGAPSADFLAVGALLQQFAASARERRAEFPARFAAFEKAVRKRRGRAKGKTAETFTRPPA
ncbi:MAG: CHAD domain-containing protein [Acidobacteriota bacterium]